METQNNPPVVPIPAGQNGEVAANFSASSSKARVMALISSISGWLSAAALAFILVGLRNLWLVDPGEDKAAAKDGLVFFVCLLVVVLAVFGYSFLKMKRISLENQDTQHRSLKINLIFGIIISLCLVLTLLYSLYQHLIARNPDVTWVSVLNWLLFLLPVAAFTYFLRIHYQKTKT